MKTILKLTLALILLLSFSIKLSAQQQLLIQFLEKSKDSKEYYRVSDNTPGTGMKGTKGFYIQKIDRASGKDLFKVELEIPDKSVMRFPQSNAASFDLVGDNIIVVYDVKQKSDKNCFMRVVNTQKGDVGQDLPVFSDKPKSIFNFHEIVYKAFYSPDYSKMAILKDNISVNNDINAEVSIYDVKTLKLISNKKLGQTYNNTKRVFELSKSKIDNNGNIRLVFNLVNEKTNMTTKTYAADLPAGANDLQNIKEQNGSSVADGSSQTSHGRFYKSIKDYVNDKPLDGVRIKNGSYSYSVVKGNDFKLIDNDGNLKKEDAKNLPSEIFTYKRDDFSEPLLMRIIDKKPYIILAVGKFSYYALYLDNQLQYYTEDWDSSDLKSYKEKVLKDYLKQYGLLDEYENSMPKREMSDNVNAWFNKNVNHNITYINKLNQKMSK